MSRVLEGTYEMREKLHGLLDGRTAIKVKEVCQLEDISESTARRMYQFVNGRISVELYVRRHLQIYGGRAPAYL